MIKLLRFDTVNSATFNLNHFSPSELAKYNSFKSEKRKCEFYYTRILWNYFEVHETIQYNEIGRPFLQNGHISISHSHDIIAVAHNFNNPVGVDVEYHSAKLRKIQNKFISQRDLELANTSNDNILTVIWSIKEAVYKMEQIEGLSFKENIRVKIGHGTALVDVVKGSEMHHYTFEFSDFGDFVLTYCSHADLNGKTLF